jgi:hypothetical protein
MQKIAILVASHLQHPAQLCCRIGSTGGGRANERSYPMWLIMMAMATVLLMVPVVPAYSQMGGNKSIAQPSPREPEKKKDEKTPEQKKADEKAYKDAVGRIPDQKFDPWRSVR